MTGRTANANGLVLLQAALLIGAMALGCSDSKNVPSRTGGGATGHADKPTPADASGAGGRDAGPGSAGVATENAGGTGQAGVGGAASAGSENAGGENAGGENAGGADGAPIEISPDPAYGASVESFAPGAGAGYNNDKLPGVVLGPPQGGGASRGSTDVVSLGAGGEIVLGFGEFGIVDGPGPDLLVFENAFWPGGDATQVFYELGEVSVSEDGKTWQTFACDTAGDGAGHFPGCAGWTPTLVYDASQLVPLDPARSGGDAFDLADVGMKHARFVKIRDLETLPPGGTTTGFDLDAVAAIHAQ